MVGASASSSHAHHLKFLARAPSDADLISREGSLGPRLVTEDFTEPVGFSFSRDRRCLSSYGYCTPRLTCLFLEALARAPVPLER
ncbi:hypothetical protein HPP92_025263 [Vanilla planifolia]|uniref:Uncharacterized protein n=1 Tax=Vanilla planifolia TaxID=51239 RepID=A0A835PLK9_VANPL|nr:hypothetical protein HPP92_025263 [Vanilla planifolia]